MERIYDRICGTIFYTIFSTWTFNIVFDTIFGTFFGQFFDDYMDRRVFGGFRKVFGHFSIQDKKGFAPLGPISWAEDGDDLLWSLKQKIKTDSLLLSLYPDLPDTWHFSANYYDNTKA